MLLFVLIVAASLQVPIHSIKRSLRIKKTESAPIEISNFFNQLYYLPILVGSSNTELSVMIDTGSKYLWLPNQNCESCEHTENFYNSSDSVTSISLESNYTFTYGQASVIGTATKDSIKLSGDNSTDLENFTFLSVTNSTNFNNLKADGILGLAFEDKTFGFKNFVEELKSHGEIGKSSFSLFLNQNELDEIITTNPAATIIFGGYDMSLALENFRYVAIDKSLRYWAASFDGIKVDRMINYEIQNTKSLILYSKYVVFHTGSYMIKAPTSEYRSLMTYITEKYSCYEVSKEIYCYCESEKSRFESDIGNFPVLRFSIGDQEFELEPEYYIQSHSGECRVMLVDAGEREYFILGLPFLRKYYTYFDYENSQIGLAPAVRAYLVVYSSSNYITLALFALSSTFVLVYLKKIHKPVKKALL